MDLHKETLLEKAQRLVAEGEAWVARQTALVAEISRDNDDTTKAEALLAAMKNTLARLREDLAHLQAANQARRQQ
jgi:cell division protein FtsB